MDPTTLGANLRRLRQASDLSQEELAARAGLSRVGYRNLETGIATPRLDTLAKIAGALGVRIDDLLRSHMELRNVRFRAQKRLTSRENVLADVARWLSDYVEVEELVGAPSAPDFRELQGRLKREGVRDPRVAARLAREWLGLGDDGIARDICGLLEDHGIKVHTPSIASEGFFGLSVAGAEVGAAVVVNCWERIAVERWIFTAVHELGHHLLHLAAFDVEVREEDEAEEREANLFASQFLVPEAVFQRELHESRGLPLYRRVMKLKRIFRVSYKTILYRMGELMNDGRSLWPRFQFEYKQIHGRSLKGHEEPDGLTPDIFQDGRPVERSSEEPEHLIPADFVKDRLHRLVRDAVERQELPLARAAEVLRIPLADMVELQESWAAQREEVGGE